MLAGLPKPKGVNMARASFHWDDPLLLEQQLTEERDGARRRARLCAAASWRRACSRRSGDEHTDPAIFSEMGALGLLGATHSGGVSAAAVSTT